MDTTDIKFLRAGIARQIKQPETLQMLRGKQIEAFRALLSDSFTDEQISHSYFKLPTGFGKTVMFATMARAYFDAIKASGIKHRPKIIIIVPRLSLINQTKEKLDKFADLVATEYSGRKKDNKSDIIITTYNSLDKLFGIIDFNDVGLIFADEAHHILGEKISKRLAFYNEYVPVIGFTATPEYEANHAVADMLNTEIFAMNIPESIEANILSPVKNVLYRSSIVCDLSEVSASTNGEFNYDEITTKISPDTLATEIARIYAEGVDEDTGIEFKSLKAIINCPNAEIADIQAAKINEFMGHDVAISLHKVGITDKEFNRLQQDFIDGKYTVACQVGTMTEGFDDVTVSMCINYPTRSRVKAEQTAGRAIRIDENNPNKIAFVVDTIFRNTPEASNEDILYTVSNSKQVLFKDIAGGMVLFPRDFQAQETQSKSPRTRGTGNVEFVDFDLITDSKTLVELNNQTQERIANETIEEKTDEWQSVVELSLDNTFPMNRYDSILKKMKELQPEMPMFIQVRKPKIGLPGLCLHRDGRQLFLEKSDIKDYPLKTYDWQSAVDLRNDKTFAMSSDQIILKKLEEFQSEMPDFIQIRKSKTKNALCLHRDGREMFLEKCGIKDYLPKTEKWLSANDLESDETFPMANKKIILRKMEELQSEMPNFIQIRKAMTRNALCLHRNGREKFLEKCGIKDYLPKTEEWLSANDLASDKTFPMGSNQSILRKMEELQSEIPDFIQMRKPKIGGGGVGLYLHRDGREMFLEKCGMKTYLPKTDEWQSRTDLSRDETFPMVNMDHIQKALEELQSEMPDFIQIRKPKSGRTGLCLHRDGREEFLRRVQESKTKSIRKAAKVISAGDEMAQTTKTIKSTAPKNISIKSL